MGAADGSIFERKTVKVDGFTIPYLQGGRGEPLVWLHGMGGGGKWESYHMALGTVSLAYAPQLPGWPEGQIPEELTSVKDYTQIVLRFLDTLGLAQVILAGHSIGGWIALYLAVEQPERVSRLLLIDAMGLDVPEAPAADLGAMDEEAFARAAFAKLGLIARSHAYFGAEWDNIRQSPDFERQWKGRSLVVQLAGGTYGDPELTDKVKRISADTLLVWGREDQIVPVRHSELLRAAVPRSVLYVIEGAGHLPMVEKRETFHRLIRDFVLGVEEPIAGVVKV